MARRHQQKLTGFWPKLATVDLDAVGKAENMVPALASFPMEAHSACSSTPSPGALQMWLQ